MSAKGALPSRKVLVVDDSPDAAEALAMLLRQLGQKVHKAHNGQTALLVAAQVKPELVFLDIVMPRMDGFETADALREMTGMAGARIIAISGFGGDDVKVMSASHNLDGFLVKPVTVEALMRLLAAH